MMTDHYNLLCYILGIEAKPNNGTWDHVKDMTSDAGAKVAQLITCALSSSTRLKNRERLNSICNYCDIS